MNSGELWISYDTGFRRRFTGWDGGNYAGDLPIEGGMTGNFGCPGCSHVTGF
jgi:hypothetical protein